MLKKQKHVGNKDVCIIAKLKRFFLTAAHSVVIPPRIYLSVEQQNIEGVCKYVKGKNQLREIS